MTSNIAAVETGPSTNSLATGLAQASQPTPNPTPNNASLGYPREAFNSSQIQTLRRPAPSFREFFQGARYPNMTQGCAVPY
jgi:hypothetical protein